MYKSVLFPKGYFQKLAVFEKKFFPQPFKKRNILLQAFFSSGYRNAPRNDGSTQLFPKELANERFEFLGDSILRFFAASWSFQKYPDYDQVKLTRLVNFITSNSNLRDLAEQHFDLIDLILDRETLLHPQERHQHNQRVDNAEYDLDSTTAPLIKRRADTVEALTAAVYMDRGLTECADFVLKHIIDPSIRILVKKNNPILVSEFETFCQQYQSEFKRVPEFRIISDSQNDYDIHVAISEQIKNDPNQYRKVEVGLYQDEKCILKGTGSTIPRARADLAQQGLKTLF